MSWSIRLIGNPELIALRIQDDDSHGMPPNIRDVCVAALGSLPCRPVIFETSGHVDSASSDFNLDITNVDEIVV